MLIKNAIIYTEQDRFLGNLLIDQGKITEISQDSLEVFNEKVEIVDANQLNLIPGFIDTHVHGANGSDVMDASTEAIQTIAKSLVTEGTTSFLATTMTQSPDAIERALENLANYQNIDHGAEMIGIHLEGPFIDKKKAGAQPVEHIIKPEINLYNRWQLLANGKIKTVTLAPEHDLDFQFTSELRRANLNVSAGHTDVSFSEMKKAVTAGVNQMTHLCNAMSGIHHQDIGAVGAAFILPELKAEIIPDGLHVDSAMLRLIYQNMGPERLLLITDSIRAKGLEPGEYDLGGQSVYYTGEHVRLENGALAGSTLRMIDGVKQINTILEVTFHDIILMTSINPAKQVGVFDQKGSIAVGKDADLLLVDDDFNLKLTLKKGEIVYQGVDQ